MSWHQIIVKYCGPPPDIFIHTLFGCTLKIKCSCCNVWQSSRNLSGLLPPAAASQPAVTAGPRMPGFLALFIHNYTLFSNFSKLLFCITCHREHISNADGAFCSIYLLYLTCSETTVWDWVNCRNKLGKPYPHSQENDVLRLYINILYLIFILLRCRPLNMHVDVNINIRIRCRFNRSKIWTEFSFYKTGQTNYK